MCRSEHSQEYEAMLRRRDLFSAAYVVVFAAVFGVALIAATIAIADFIGPSERPVNPTERSSRAMSESKSRPVTAAHAVITPYCRELHGYAGAFEVAVLRLRKAYDEHVSAPANENADWHLVLTVERKEDPDAE